MVASSVVALAAVGAQIWQGHLNRESERRAWLRDRRAEAYISVLKLFAKTPDQVTQPEWEELTARVAAFSSLPMGALFNRWSEVVAEANGGSLSKEAYGEALKLSEDLQEQIRDQVATELQGSVPRKLPASEHGAHGDESAHVNPPGA